VGQVSLHPSEGREGPLADRPVEQPLLSVGGELDSALRFGSLEPMRVLARNLVKVVVLPGCGHWTQQERPTDGTREMVAFLGRPGVHGPPP
jgi:pimeloyl-ACP methyl ester carboxylesterase